MKLYTRILYGFVSVVFLISAIVQFHHHHDDGGMCMCFHMDVCEQINDVDASQCDGECISETHHHCTDADCSLHLSDTVMNSAGNHDVNNQMFAGHVHGMMCAILCLLDLSFFVNETRDKVWLCPRDEGKAVSLFLSGWGFRAPPEA